MSEDDEDAFKSKRKDRVMSTESTDDPTKRVRSRPARYKDDRKNTRTLSSSTRKQLAFAASSPSPGKTPGKIRGPYKKRAAVTDPAGDAKKRGRGPGRNSLGHALRTTSAIPMIRLNLKTVDRFSGVISGKDAEISPYCPSHVDLKAFDGAKELALVCFGDAYS